MRRGCIGDVMGLIFFAHIKVEIKDKYNKGWMICV